MSLHFLSQFTIDSFLYLQFPSVETSSPKATLPIIYCWYPVPSKLSVQSRHSVNTFARKSFLSGSILVNYILLEDILCSSNFLKWVNVIFIIWNNKDFEQYWMSKYIMRFCSQKKKSHEYYVRRNLYTWEEKKSLCPVSYTVPKRNDKGSYTLSSNFMTAFQFLWVFIGGQRGK